MTDRASYQVGAYVFEPFNARLLRDGDVIPLTAKTADMLLALVRQPNVIVSKETLMTEVWRGVAVEENNLNQQISALRKALGGSDAGVSIETVPRRGFRLAGEVRLHQAVELPATIPAISSRTIPGANRFVTATAVAVLATVSFIAWHSPSSSHATGESEVRKKSEVLRQRGDDFREQGNDRAALADLKEAISVDPTNARAYGSLAFALHSVDRGTSTSAVRPAGASPSVDAARRGVEQDPRCGSCRGTYGFFLFYHDWQFAAAEEQFREALRLEPSNGSVRPAYAMLLAVTGRPDAAIEQVDIGLKSDPYQVRWLEIRASALYFAQRYDEAIATADRALAISRTHRPAWDWRSKALFQLGRGREGIHALAQALFVEHSRDLERAVDAGGAAGGLRKALQLTDDWRGRIEHSWRRAAWRALLDDREGALEELERAHQARRFNAINLGADPVYDGIREQPRFRRLLEGMNLAGSFPEK